jgi:import inner membrane translocase subunit TIM50
MFLSQVGYPNFEVVVYTTESAFTFYPIIDGLDPNNQFIMYRLFRDATRYLDGHQTKDLRDGICRKFDHSVTTTL